MQRPLIPTCLIALLIFSAIPALAQHTRRELTAIRTSQSLHIDGKLDEADWKNAHIATGFFQYDPHNDRPASLETFVKVLFDDHALYIGARLSDPQPEKILTEMGLRDANDNINADQFWIDINPFNDGINGFRFKVSSSGVQTDVNLSGSNGSRGDINWDAVWMSAVSIDSLGWTAELKIPYAALRFPAGENRQWGINFWREIRRTREQSSWNFADRKVDNHLAFMGLLNGMTGIKPPLRLAFFPYISGYLQNNSGNQLTSHSFIAGMDVKYGISNSFTMDMTLIPDFGQVQSDALVLNLSPYEVKYDENRQFFTEGTELFSKADIFYSRRIGSRPINYQQANKELSDNEILEANPNETRMLNATKISGRTSFGLGMGVFNAITAPTKALLKDTLSEEIREIQTQGLTNYNVLVLDQSLKNNSFISLINTNMSGAAPDYMANVSASEFRFMDARNTFRTYGSAALSQQYRPGDNTFGYYYDLSIGKEAGQWQYTYNREVLSDTYNPNDMGYLAHNNWKGDKISLSHNVFKPFWKLWNLRNEVSFTYSRLHTPDTFTGMNLAYNMRMLFNTRFFIMSRINYKPLGVKDYFVTRVPGRFYQTPAASDFFLLYSSDYRKRIYIDGDFSYGQTYTQTPNQKYGFEIRPTMRINDRMSLTYGFRYATTLQEVGFGRVITNDSIQFGLRNINTFTNTIRTAYIFNNHLSLNFNLRHYWSSAKYTGEYFLIGTDGSLNPFPNAKPRDPINYNAFTIDMLLTWNFAPGSHLVLAWKNNINSQTNLLINSYWDNLGQTLERPQINSLSLKILYYIDYNNFRNIFS